jgi:hypothetical protein
VCGLTNANEERFGGFGDLESERQLALRRRIAEQLIQQADRTPMNRRLWFRISEIVDYCARIPGSIALDQSKRERSIELLRRAILAGEFDDPNGRSKIANLHSHRTAVLRRFARNSATAPEFGQWISYLWIRRADCEAWFSRNRIDFPEEWLPPVPRYPLPAKKPLKGELAFAYDVLRDRWGMEGPPQMKVVDITREANAHLKANAHRLRRPDGNAKGSLSDSTVRRVLGIGT